jgi:class 3 adenylate cyclase/tRNA A-37 threonylcarbamoyl transferase component Bud32
VTFEAGRTFGPYRIGPMLGRGATGSVYEAVDERLDRRVALKVLSPELAAQSSFRSRFIAESRVAASLDHPNIIPVFEAGELDGQLFMAMRLVAGGRDLDILLRENGPLLPDRALAVVGQVADALDAAHAAGLIHRDVKPGNILVTTISGRDHAYLCDFGLARAREYAGGVTRTGELVGTVDYVAPEVIEGAAIDGRVDLYSLGCVLFETLTGAPPYRRDSDVASLYAHMHATAPSVHEREASLPAAVDTVIARALAKDPDERYATGAELVAAARAALAGTTQVDIAASPTRGFLFSDLRGYTAYVEAHGDEEAAVLLDRYRRMVRAVVAQTAGSEVRTEGDSFYVLFPSASKAITAALAIVAEAEKRNRGDPGHQISVGIGVHAGETAETAEGPVGSAVNVAARICSVAGAGEVWVSETVRGLTRTRLADVAYLAKGSHQLKGVAEPMTLYQVLPKDRAPTGAPSASGPTRVRGARRRGRALAAAAGTAAIALALLGVSVVLAPSGDRPGASPSTAPSLGGAAPLPSNTEAASGAIASGDRDRIVFSIQEVADDGQPSCDTGLDAGYQRENRLAVLDPATGAVGVPLPTSDVFQRSPASGPSGTIGFVGQDENGRSPWTLDPSSLAVSPLRDDITSLQGLAWSATAGRWALLNEGRITTTAADGSDPIDVRRPVSIKDSSPDSAPNEGFSSVTWTPDGRIAFVRREVAQDGQEGIGELMSIDAGGGGYSRVIELLGFDVRSATWSPDGATIAIVGAETGDEGVQVWLVAPDGTGLRQLTTTGSSFDPAWSPDGSRLVFSSDRDGSVDLYTVGRTGGEPQKVTNLDSRDAACWPAWSSFPEAIPDLAAIPAPTPGADGSLPFHLGRLAPGRYADKSFGPGFSVDLPAGWHGLEDLSDSAILGRGTQLVELMKVSGAYPTGCVLDQPGPIGARPRDVIDFLRTASFLRTTGYQSGTIDGHPALSLTIELARNPKCGFDRARKPVLGLASGSFTIRAGERKRVTAIDVGGDTVVVSLGGPVADVAPADDAVVRSLHFVP